MFDRPRSANPMLAGAVAVLCALGCGQKVLTPRLHDPSSPPPPATDGAVLKVHMRSGELYALTTWKEAPDGKVVEGIGTRYSLSRVPGTQGKVSIPVADVALFETNRTETVGKGGTTALAVMTTVFGLVTGYCLADPKACFGSCPTFYLEGADAEGRPVAEGFSASIARALEARDVDAIGAAPGAGGRFTLTMRNEAFETHAVRRVALLAAERPPGGTVIAGADGLFHPASDLALPRSCRAAEGDCLRAVAAQDAVERFSEADPRDLATREVVELSFAPARGRVGLVLAGRQTLLSTQLFYQMLAYFGTRAGDYLASVERGGPAVAARAMGMARVLGGIDAELSEGDGDWRPIGAFEEAGPIAGDVVVLPFEAAGDAPLRVRLRQAKGHFRLDRVALARLGPPLTPRRLEPVSVQRHGRDDPRARELLRRGAGHLVTGPGDAYRIAFALPRTDGELELFLESEGYYYEWMREEWLAEENAEMAALVLADPGEALRRMAGRFRQQGPELEQAFWASRFRR